MPGAQRAHGSPAYYAHTLPNRSPEEWQPLRDHLVNVADLAGSFASAFGAKEWGHPAGMWHDLGKFSETFQLYLAAHGDYHREEVASSDADPATPLKTDHTSAGAQHAVSRAAIPGHLLAYAIAGHHAGLLDGISEGACLDKRLRKQVDPWEHGLGEMPPLASPEEFPAVLREALDRRAESPEEAAFTFAFFTRMLFSCLVDADFLDTERFMDPAKHESRLRWPDDVLERMARTLDCYAEGLQQAPTPVDEERRRVREACLEAADMEPGLFSLTVPTGGGKTLSSLAFALRHAQIHNLSRVIYVIPFTSIIEQNADVFRRALASMADIPDPVVEHHSALDAGSETLTSRLAAENWDAPLIVTTSVQFYESLFANRPGRCRKLHNLARSVIVLDEVQKLPVSYLHPCLLALRELSAHYMSSVVLCTATQPAVVRREGFPIGLKDVREIVPDPPGLYAALKRVVVRDLGSLSDEELTEKILREPQVLTILNTRRHARVLFERIGEQEGCVHLSAAMCPAHRSEVLDDVRKRLDRGEPCRVVATQLIEAGVDVDFRVVFRSLAGLDALAQAAGRCNRNGRFGSGVTFVFRSEHRDSECFLRETAQVADQLLGAGSSPPLFDDLLSLEAVERYFQLYYWSQQTRWDEKGIVTDTRLANRKDLPFLFSFADIARKFRLIEDSGQPVIIPWGKEGRELCDRLRFATELPDTRLLRMLQRYTVQVSQRVWGQRLGRSIELVHDQYPLLVSPDIHYDERLGLVLDRDDHNPATFLI
ncbi:CRISPR-associated helicase Cas3' [Candidatus Fermentibacteria bacterium]|nr:CRISPR-associated helicase Cas3' [Candidatus Fermentibacteria bacterium]